MTTSRRILVLAICLSAGLLCGGARAAAMSFEVVAGPAECAARTCILASGPIDEHTVRAFKAVLRASGFPKAALVVFNSTGGDLFQSFDLGETIRGAGYSTTVRAYDRATRQFRPGGECSSACAYAFLGGVDRSLGPGARIGVHQVTTMGSDWEMTAPDGLKLMGEVGAYLSLLSGHSDLLIPALATPPDQMHWLSPPELRRYNVVTDAAAPAPADGR